MNSKLETSTNLEIEDRFSLMRAYLMEFFDLNEGESLHSWYKKAVGKHTHRYVDNCLIPYLKVEYKIDIVAAIVAERNESEVLTEQIASNVLEVLI